MFSSLASFIFGSNTNSETNQNPTRQQQQQQRQQQQQQQQNQQQQQDQKRDEDNVRIDAENTIEVTSSTPSVTGTRPSNVTAQGKRAKNKRTRNNRNKRQQQGSKAAGAAVKPSIPSISKLLTPSDSFDEEIDEDDWFIVEREEEDDSLPRTDSEEDLSIVEIKPKYTSAIPQSPINNRRRANFNFHSLYGGPRPQQQRNFLQRARNAGARSGAGLSLSTLNPPRSIAVGVIGAGANDALADVGMTQSLYVAPHNRDDGCNGSGSGNEIGAHISMEESWFVTPPPCFTSIGPINMESSPFENLLIEHPSMSVYHSIRSAQEATESFVNLDLGVVESQQKRHDLAMPAAKKTKVARKTQLVPQRSTGVNVERYSAAQVKQALFAQSTQKHHDIIDRQSMCRGAIKRANKVRDFQSKGNRQRRADMQHCKIVSGANNNRKCCF